MKLAETMTNTRAFIKDLSMLFRSDLKVAEGVSGVKNTKFIKTVFKNDCQHI